jgi:uncharacterized integral membrane protein
MQFLLIVALGLAILTVIFALQNPIPVGVRFFFGNSKARWRWS